MKIDDLGKFHQITLSRYQIGSTRILRDFPGAYLNAEISTIDHVLSGLCVSLRTWLLAGKHEQEPLVVKFWASWWDHFKAEKFPEWAKRRWPPQEEIREFVKPHNVFVCPHSDYKWPDARHIKFMLQENEG